MLNNKATGGEHAVYVRAYALFVLCPRPRRGGGGIRRSSASVVRPSVRPSVCPSDVAYIGSNSKTKRPRKTKLCTGYPRPHATPTPTSRSKGQKSRSRGQLVHRSEMCKYFANGKSYDLQIWHAYRPWAVLAPDHKLARNWAMPGAGAPISTFWDPLNILQTGKATIFKFGMHIGRGQFLPMDHKLAPKWAWPGVRDPISKFSDPLNISQTEKATIFQFGMHIGRGQFFPPDHKLGRN